MKPKDDDSIVVMLSAGEYRVSQAALDYYGEKLLTEINRMPLEKQHDPYGHLVRGAFHNTKLAKGGIVTGSVMNHPYGKGPDAWPHNLNEEVAAKQRKLSPKFPTLAEAAILRRDRRDLALTRLCGAIMFTGGVLVFYDPPLGAGILLAGMLGYTVVAGVSDWKRRRDRRKALIKIEDL